MENKSILLIVASILLSGMMIASAVLYNGAQSRANNNTASNTDSQQEQDDPVDARNISVDLSKDTPYLGSKSKSQIAIIEFSDFECPFCKKFHDEARKEIIEQYVNTDKAILAWKDYPLDFHDPLATKQAVAAQCVYEQKGNQAYFEYVDLIL